MDVIADYLGAQYVVEMKRPAASCGELKNPERLKLWRGKAYNERGERRKGT